MKCPDVNVSSSSHLQEFIVFLNTSESTHKSMKKAHFKMLNTCLGHKVEKVTSITSKNGMVKRCDKNIIRDFSVDGSFAAYTGFFDKTFVNYLSNLNDVEFVEKVTKVHISKTTTQTNAPFNLDRIDQANFPLDKNYKFPSEAGCLVNVYVIDTGIDTDNVEFEGRAVFGGVFCDGCAKKDDNGHGTNVAGIIGGKVFGVAKKTQLISVRVLDRIGAGTTTTVSAGIAFVLDRHKKSKNKNTVINISIGGRLSQTINRLIEECTKAGIHVVVSSGNDSEDACNTSPASAPSAITVGATEKSSNNVTDFSNTGSCLDIFAPGRDILAAGLGRSKLLLLTGTSQASPHVAGVLALIISKNGNMSPSMMAKELTRISTKGIVKGLKSDTINLFLRVPN
ncbi:11343_t:CDS:2 [Funneliformis geosporum]|uniref:11096_t:CDS:1 n=1 Tax=Funneliformis geosporum TaxID=1117311 RepID=A0A9W4SQX3_9GLOM|nr:11096_t:CDS:2 [Funneliformis geosporum]CAI2179947.1 11343_t:CDS:2 [Funneliformis geosporum]